MRRPAWLQHQRVVLGSRNVLVPGSRHLHFCSPYDTTRRARTGYAHRVYTLSVVASNPRHTLRLSHPYMYLESSFGDEMVVGRF